MHNFKRPLLMAAICLASLSSGLVFAGTMQFKKLSAQKQFQITYGDLEVTLGDRENCFSVNGLRHGGLGVEFGRWPQQATPAPLWKIRFTDDLAASGKFAELNSLGSCSRSLSFDSQAGLTLFYKGLDLPNEPKAIDVTVYIRPRQESSMTAWKIKVTNQSDTFAIYDVRFPIISLGNINGDGSSSCLNIPRAEGRSSMDPIHSGQLGAAAEAGIDYPSPQGQMQYSAYYQDFGHFYYPDKKRGAGVYFAVDDGVPIWPKTFFYKMDEQKELWEYSCRNHPNDVDAIGVNYEMPYEHVMGVYVGDWFEASQIYRQWALQQHWTRKGPLAQRADVPDWYKQITAVYRISGRRQRPEAAAEAALEFCKKITGPIMAQWYQWGSSIDNDYPAVAKTQDGFAQATKKLLAENVYVFPYMGGRIWRLADADWPTAKKYANRKRDGTLNILGEDKAAFMCFAPSFWRDYQANACREIASKYGVKGIYTDQLGGIKFGCFDRSHGHPLGFTQDTTRVNHLSLEQNAAAAHSVDPEIMLCGEGSTEFSMDELNGKIMHFTLWDEALPLYSAVYHDYMPFFGRNLNLSSKKNPDQPAMQAGWMFTIGAQIGRVFGPVNLNSPKNQRILNYLARLTRAKKEATQYLSLGQMMRPPLIDTKLNPEVTTSFRKNRTMTLPAILGSVWKNAEGKIALTVTNISEKALTFDVEMNLDDYDIKPAECYRLYELGHLENIVWKSKERVLQCSLQLDSLGVKVYELSPQSQ